MIRVFSQKCFGILANLDKLTGTGAIGHVRYATAGEASVDNIQPFLFRFHDTQFGLAHNGNLTNAKSLKRELENNGAIFSSTSDSEILAHLIRRSHNPSFMGKVKEALNTVKGGFAYLLMLEDKLIAALDPNGFRPLRLGKWPTELSWFHLKPVPLKWLEQSGFGM